MVSKVDNQKNGGKENGISQQGVLDGKGRNDDRGLHARTKAELTEFIRHIATIATKDCKNQLETKETDPMSEMIAREYTEELIKEKLHQKLKEYQTEDDEDEEQYTMEEMMLFKERVDSLDN